MTLLQVVEWIFPKVVAEIRSEAWRQSRLETIAEFQAIMRNLHEKRLTIMRGT